jgi:hypothetical protein
MVAECMVTQAVARSDVRFSRREVREATAWGDTQLRVHLDRLVAMEYLLVHRGSRGQSFVYELLYDGDGSAAPYLPGLIDVATMATSRGSDSENAGASRPARGNSAATSHTVETAANAGVATLAGNVPHTSRQTHTLSTTAASPSYIAASRLA